MAKYPSSSMFQKHGILWYIYITQFKMRTLVSADVFLSSSRSLRFLCSIGKHCDHLHPHVTPYLTFFKTSSGTWISGLAQSTLKATSPFIFLTPVTFHEMTYNRTTCPTWFLLSSDSVGSIHKWHTYIVVARGHKKVL